MKKYSPQQNLVYSNGTMAQQLNLYDAITAAGRGLLKRGEELWVDLIGL